jgi:nucleotide-binding universal stress UspA family protein
MFRRILVPLDGSDRAAQAIPVAARIARASDGSIFLARAATIPSVYGTFSENSYMAEIIESEMRNASDYLAVMAHSPTLSGITVETSVLYGAAAPTLLAMATHYGADLIVMTSQGQTGVKRWLLGSVAHKMARQSPVPVLVLREGGALPVGARADSSPLRALVTLDGSVLAKAALEPAVQLIAALSAPTPGALHLLRVVKPPAIERQADDSEEYRERLREQAMHKARLYLQSVVEHLRAGYAGKLKLGVTWSVALSDEVAEAIIQAAEYGEDAAGAGVYGRCDMIAMATHGRAGFQRWALGSVAERVLGATRLPLLIVRPTEVEFRKTREEKVPASQGI